MNYTSQPLSVFGLNLSNNDGDVNQCVKCSGYYSDENFFYCEVCDDLVCSPCIDIWLICYPCQREQFCVAQSRPYLDSALPDPIFDWIPTVPDLVSYHEKQLLKIAALCLNRIKPKPPKAIRHLIFNLTLCEEDTELIGDSQHKHDLTNNQLDVELDDYFRFDPRRLVSLSEPTPAQTTTKSK